MKESLSKTMCITPFLLPQIITSIFTSAADKSHHKFKLLQILHYLLSLSLFLFHFFLSLLQTLTPSLHSSTVINPNPNVIVKKEHEILHQGDSGISRALAQILSIMNEIPVTSRKYETVRLLAEKIIDENLEEGCEALKEVNRMVLRNAFGKTIGQLEAAMREQGDEISGSGSLDGKMGWIWNAVRVVRDGAVCRVNGEEDGCSSRPVGWSAEKFAAEVYWLAKKLVACGNGEEAVKSWGSASNLAVLALSAEPRVQSCLVKVSAFLFKEEKEIGESDEQRRKMMLMSWLPLLCCASNGTDSPVLSSIERMELEKVLEEMIGLLTQKDDQEKVLALWLHHFTSCSSSDWPNLQACYTRWCQASRKELAAQ
ncbi:hypothetical protein ACHQM5_023562 [Ranunculus cassubicifolius]